MVKALQVKDFPDYYITENGDVYSRNYCKTGRIKKITPRITNSGYFLIHLHKNHKRYAKTIHRLVAETFIQNSYNKPQVNHKNGVKTDNRVANLEWNTLSENVLHSFRKLGQRGTWLGKTGKAHPCSKKVIQTKNGAIVATFYGTQEAARNTGIRQDDICRCCNGIRKTAGGYQWKYKEQGGL